MKLLRAVLGPLQLPWAVCVPGAVLTNYIHTFLMSELNRAAAKNKLPTPRIPFAHGRGEFGVSGVGETGGKGDEVCVSGKVGLIWIGVEEGDVLVGV